MSGCELCGGKGYIHDDSGHGHPCPAACDLRASLDQALDLLRELHDFSGDPASYRNHDRWHAAMRAAAELLRKHGK